MDTDDILLEQFIKSHPFQVAQGIEAHKIEDIAAFIDEIPSDLVINIISRMNSDKAAKCMEIIKPDRALALLEKLDVQFAELILRQSEEHFREKILTSISPKLAKALRRKLEHAAYTVGSLMNPAAFGLRKEYTVEKAKEIVRGENKRMGSVVAVVNAAGKLEGIVKSHELFLTADNSLIASIMKTEVPKFTTVLPIESVINHTGWFEYHSIPVIDRFNKFVGMLDYQTVSKNRASTSQKLNKHIVDTSHSLGELYRIGLTSLLQSVSK